MCGVMREFYDEHINMLDCSEERLPFHYICEFEPAEEEKEEEEEDSLQGTTTAAGGGVPAAQEASSIQLADLTQAADLSLPFPSVRCPRQHRTHTFLACDAESDCWARPDPGGLTPGASDWDAPASSWCDVTMPSLPLQFLCGQGGQRVPFTLVCDSRADCVDRSDELFCVHPPCPAHKSRRCGNSPQVRCTVRVVTV